MAETFFKPSVGGKDVSVVTSTNAVVDPELGATLSEMTTEINVSKLYPTGGVGGTNKYTLEGAIAKIPTKLRTVGIKCSFLDDQNFVCEYVYNGNGSPESAIFWEAIGKKRIDIIDRKSEMATGYRFADCGKNLFDKRKIIPGYFYNKDKRVTNNEYVLSHFIPVTSGKTYYISNTGVGGANHCIFDAEARLVKTAKDGAVTVPSGGCYLQLSVGVAKVSKVQVETGEAVTAYEEYTDDFNNMAEHARINHLIMQRTEFVPTSSPQKNLFDKSVAVDGFLRNDGNITNSSDYKTSDFISVRAGESITASPLAKGPIYLCEFDAQKALVKATQNTLDTITIALQPTTRYIRATFLAAKVDVAQVEYGTKKTGYEPYRRLIDPNWLPEHLSIQDVKKYVDDNVVTPEYIEIPAKNLFDKTKIETGFIHPSDGTLVSNSAYVASAYIPVVGGEYVTASPLGKGPIGFSQYDKRKTFIKSTRQNVVTLTVKLEANCAYIRSTFEASNYETAQVEYGQVKTEFEPYQHRKVISEEWLPEQKDVVDEEAISKIVDAQLTGKIFSPKLILPVDIYLKTGRTNNIYVKQATRCSATSEFSYELNVAKVLKAFERQMSGVPSAANTTEERVRIYYEGRMSDEKKLNLHVIDKKTSPKSVNILDSGDSLSDLGQWQAELKDLLKESNVTANYIGTMINQVNCGGSMKTEIWGEVLSGGNMSFITEANGAAKILTVANITELPETGYPGTSYNDENGNSWVVRGFKLTKGPGEKYSGKLKIGKFKSDPNYGDGTSSDTSGTGTFPPAGNLTKTNSSKGDATIAYTSVDDARFNPYWNPITDRLDFKYYIDYWEFPEPDIFMMQWGFNEVTSYNSLNSSEITTAKSRAIAILDRFHEQYPNAKVIFGVEMYGWEIQKYTGGSGNNSDGKKYSMLNFAQVMIELAESEKYKNFVTVVPLYAMMDHINGYGPIVELALCDLYDGGVKQKVGQQGRDGVHPKWEAGGLREVARAYEPVVLHCIV